MRRPVGAVLCAALVLPALAGCGGDGDGGRRGLRGAGPDATSRATSAAAPALPQDDEPVALDPHELGPDVDNRWFPLRPGTRWTYQEVTEDGGNVRVVVTATSVTRRIANGVLARVVRDTVTLDGSVIEDTLDWYAQDHEGTVWYLGEDTAELEDGELVNRKGSFEAGVDGALPGVIMPGRPQLGQTYRQEYYAGVAEDNGEVLSRSARAEVPAGRYDGLLQTADTNALEPGALEHKYYAAGVGLVLTVDVESGGREELLSVTRVPPAEAERAGRAGLGERY